MDSPLLLTFTMAIAAYLLGSISSAVLICRVFRLPDPRHSGSGNPGATNVLRLGGKLPAILVLLCDILKGTIPVWGCYFLGLSPWALAAIGVAATLGHIYPIFFGFDGGKGVATALGAIAPIGWELLLALAITWLVVALITRYSSLAAIISCGLAPLFTFFFKAQYTGSVSVLIALILWRHRDNFIRLYKGTEPKLGTKRTTAPEP